jgi:hypothetical protein
MNPSEIFSILGSNTLAALWTALAVTCLSIIAMAIVNKSKLKDNGIWEGLGLVGFIAIIVSGILGLGCLALDKEAKHISRVLSNPGVKVVAAEFIRDGVQVTIRSPEETEITNVLGEPIPTIKVPAREAVLPPEVVQALDKKDFRIAGKSIKSSLASLNP